MKDLLLICAAASEKREMVEHVIEAIDRFKPRSEGKMLHKLSDEVTDHLTPCFRSFTVLFCARYEFNNCMGDFGTRFRGISELPGWLN